MKTEDPAFPQGMPEHGSKLGLSKREYFAAMAMQGFIACDAGIAKEKVAQYGVEQADQLILELAK